MVCGVSRAQEEEEEEEESGYRRTETGDRRGKTREPESQEEENDRDKYLKKRVEIREKNLVNKAISKRIWQGEQWEQNEGWNNERKSQDTVKATEPQHEGRGLPMPYAGVCCQFAENLQVITPYGRGRSLPARWRFPPAARICSSAQMPSLYCFAQ